MTDEIIAQSLDMAMSFATVDEDDKNLPDIVMDAGKEVAVKDASSKEIVVSMLGDDDAKIEEDAEFARQNMKTIINQGSEALTDILSLAKQAQSPDAFDVVAKLIKAITSANTNLMNVHKTKKEIAKNAPFNDESFDRPGGGGGQRATTITNNIQYNMTTDEAMEHMARNNELEIIDHEEE